MVATVVLSGLVGLILVISTVQMIVEAHRTHSRAAAEFHDQLARVVEGAERARSDRLLVAEARALVRQKHSAD